MDWRGTIGSGCALHARDGLAAVSSRIARDRRSRVERLHLLVATGAVGGHGVVHEAHARHVADDLAQRALDPLLHVFGALASGDDRLGASLDDALVQDDPAHAALPVALVDEHHVQLRVREPNGLERALHRTLDVAVDAVVGVRTGVNPDLDDDGGGGGGQLLPLLLGFCAPHCAKRWKIIVKNRDLVKPIPIF